MIFQQFNLSGRLDVLTNVLIGRLQKRSTLSSLFKLFSEEERAAAVASFGTLFAGTLYDVYGDVLAPAKRFNPARARKKRGLRAGTPEVHAFATADGKTRRRYLFDGVEVDEMLAAEVAYYGRLVLAHFEDATRIPKVSSLP